MAVGLPRKGTCAELHTLDQRVRLLAKYNQKVTASLFLRVLTVLVSSMRCTLRWHLATDNAFQHVSKGGACPPHHLKRLIMYQRT